MSELVYFLTGAVIWTVGLQGLLLVQHVLRRIIAVNLMGSGVFLVLVALATRSSPPDPVLQALVVTGLVVAISATAFAVRLASAQAQHAAGPSSGGANSSRVPKESR